MVQHVDLNRSLMKRILVILICTHVCNILFSRDIDSSVLALVLDSNTGKYSISTNLQSWSSGQISTLSNVLSHISIRTNDVVCIEVVGDSRDYARIVESLAVRKWVGPAMYLLRTRSRTIGNTNMYIYHWVSPYNEPRNLNETFYFLNGKGLGKGMAGARTMLRDIEARRDCTIMLLSNAYVGDAYASIEEPHDGIALKIIETAEKNNIKRIYPNSVSYLNR